MDILIARENEWEGTPVYNFIYINILDTNYSFNDQFVWLKMLHPEYWTNLVATQLHANILAAFIDKLHCNGLRTFLLMCELRHSPFLTRIKFQIFHGIKN
ncbi:hypothetical protein CUC53_11340 [Aeromonas cavernicola]|uniref:Uncharacterized protein n=1 Tax=Aeromonas cavernicola TaxID=1006623 RepID=A0A2H9U3Q3_9GAMM|nr:hypothetical protein CUC53_11340 [Aeromonas cavernicola]